MSKSRLKPILLVELINILGFFLVFMFNGEYNMNIVYAGISLCAVNLIVYALVYYGNLGDGYLFLIVSMLVSIGMIMMFRLSIDRGFHQFQWFGVGIVIMFISYFIYKSFSRWDRIYRVYIWLTVILFMSTLIFGKTISGARNWIIIGGRSIQPSEIIKLLYAFTLASYFAKNNTDEKTGSALILGIRKHECMLMLYVYTCLGFLVIQKEWGTALLFALMYFAMMYLYKSDIRLKLLNLLLVSIGGVGGYFLTDHIRVRVSTWLDPWADATNRGYQITQSLIAIASGGFFGTGVGNGNPYFIPEVHSDFIFSAICEEMGLFMGVAIIILYFMFSYRGFKIALKAKNEFHKALSLALVISFGFQTFIIVGGVIKMIPLTGITLPFVSYGGSSMVSCFIILGLLTAISHIDS